MILLVVKLAGPVVATFQEALQSGTENVLLWGEFSSLIYLVEPCTNVANMLQTCQSTIPSPYSRLVGAAVAYLIRLPILLGSNVELMA